MNKRARPEQALITGSQRREILPPSIHDYGQLSIKPVINFNREPTDNKASSQLNREGIPIISHQ